MRKIKEFKKLIYISIGLIAFALGAIGVILPVIPTTPFLLLASYCFARGSKKFETWFTQSKIYKKYLESFVKERSMTLKQKISLLAFADIMIAFPLFIIDNLYMKAFLVMLILFKFYYFIFRIKTIKNVEEKTDDLINVEKAN